MNSSIPEAFGGPLGGAPSEKAMAQKNALLAGLNEPQRAA
ncbi:MAG: hypothetical protein RIQ55_1367, partial [Pseudomonadota bacterium]